MGASAGTGYGPGSLSSPYQMNAMGTNGCVPGTVTKGMPMGPPSHKPAPKSGCIPVVAPMLVTYACELGATGRLSMRRFQMLSPGKTLHPPSVGPPVLEGTDGVKVAVTVGVAGIDVAV